MARFALSIPSMAMRNLKECEKVDTHFERTFPLSVMSNELTLPAHQVYDR